MSNILIVVGLVSLFTCGVLLSSYGIVSIDGDGPSIKNILLLLIGVIMIALYFYLLKRAGDSNHKVFEKTHPVEIVTSSPPQVDTTITIKNDITDTTYIYIFNRQFIMQ